MPSAARSHCSDPTLEHDIHQLGELGSRVISCFLQDQGHVAELYEI